MSQTKLKKVVIKMGGEEKLRIILRDFYKRMSQDILIGFFFSHLDTNQIADSQAKFILFAMGESHSYTGKTPTSAHLELPPILDGHFNRRIVILEQTLKDYQLDRIDRDTWIEFENAFRKIIVKD